MDKNAIYVLNPEYRLKKDKYRIFLFNASTDPLMNETVSDFMGMVHPLYAILFSLFDGEDRLSGIISKAAGLLGLKEVAIENIISPLIENREDLHINFEDYYYHFPKNLLIKNTSGIQVKKYDIKEFFIPKDKLDLASWRLNSPLDILFMVNTKCLTDCVYCYADRRKKIDCLIPLNRLKELIKEARHLDMRSFDLTGGELFLYPHWEELLAELLSYEFMPYISTKIPLFLDTIKRLKNIGIKRVQLSVDSIIEEEMMLILGVKQAYHAEMLNTIRNLDEYGFQVYINSQICSINSNLENVKKLLDFLLGLKNIKRISIGAAGYSLYRGDEEYLKYRAHLKDIKEIEKYVEDIKEKNIDKVRINFSGYFQQSDYITNDEENKKKKFAERARCSGNFYALVLLPDGKVTVCEELYRHPSFIIGDVTKQSIEEVWNSEAAVGLYRLAKESIGNESVCKNCDVFDGCRQMKGVCWKEILYAYGFDNWDYPDPKCPKAPEPFRTYYLE